MITPGLERIIQMGKARAHTFTFGAGAVGRIPCPLNSFLIIHHFDYWHFVDFPTNVGLPATSVFQFQVTDPTQLFELNIDIPGIGLVVADVEVDDPATSLLNVATALTALAPGWTVALVFAGANSQQYRITTTSPGTAFNGVIMTISTPDVVPGFVVNFNTPFAGGVNFSPLSVESFLTHATHQLEFRSTKGRNHFVIQEPVQFLPYFDQNNGTTGFYANVGGFYPKDCYLVHTEPVQINLLGVPQVKNWAITTYAPPAAKAQENSPPVGYGVPGLGQNTVKEIFFNAVGPTQQYLPLTSDFESIAATTQYRGEFKVDVNIENRLNNPSIGSGIPGNVPTYPLINIDYVQVDMNYNEFVKASNG